MVESGGRWKIVEEGMWIEAAGMGLAHWSFSVMMVGGEVASLSLSVLSLITI